MANYTLTVDTNIDALVNRTGTRAAVPWTRSTTTATVTFTNHGFATGALVQVTVTSDAAAITLGSKSITVVNANTFTFTCLNAGAASGTITYTAPDALTINGATVTIDQDFGAGSAVELDCALGTVSMSASLGGNLEIDARAVRLIPYNTGTGNVPAFNTAISQGGVTGKLIGVYSAINAVPTQAGGAMPASGFIKVKQVTGGAYAAGALTGIGASATGADTPGWIIVNAVEGLTATVNRLNRFRVRGDWFELGTTTGANTGTYQCPNNGKAVYIPGVWVETAASSGVYEFYPNMGSVTALVANIGTEAVRGKVCWISSTGLVRFQNDGTNSTGGFLPASGLRVRIPSVILQNVTAAAQATVALPNATLGTRYDWTTTGGGAVSLSNVACAWHVNFAQAYSVSLNDMATFSQVSLSEIAAPLTWSNVGIGQEAANTQTGLSILNCYAGGTITDMIVTRNGLAANANLCVFTDSIGFTFVRLTMRGVTLRSATTAYGISATRCTSFVFTTPTFIGCSANLITCTTMTFTDTVYMDLAAGTTGTANALVIYTIGSVCQDILINGLTFGSGLPFAMPYSGLVNITTAACKNIKVRNFGTPSAPLELGGPRVLGVSWSRATTTATVTSTAHGLKTGDIIDCNISSDIAAITLGAKTITVTNANTFTFTCLNAGAASGTLSYNPVFTANGVTLAGGAAANTIKLQRLYLKNLRTAFTSNDNSSKNILMESCWSLPSNTYGWAAALLNCNIRNVAVPFTTTAQTAVYGTHFVDHIRAETMPTLSGLAWTRVTTTATVTCTDHNLRTGDIVNVTVSSTTAAVDLGIRSVTVLTKDTFTITATNAGATSGTLTVEQHNGRFVLLGNEPTTETATQVVTEAGAPSFTSSGLRYMPTVGDQILYETPQYIKGYTGFGIDQLTMTGVSTFNFDVFYDLDTGSGFSGTYKNLNYLRTGGSGSNGASTITVTDATGVSAGDYVSAVNIAPNAKVVSVAVNTITLDRPNTGAVSGNIRFNKLPSETISPTTGFKIRIRIKTLSANTQAQDFFSFPLVSTGTARNEQYPLDTLTFTVNGLIAGSEVRAYVGTNPATAVQLGGIESSGTSFSFTHSSGGLAGYVIIHKEDYEAVYVPITYSTADESLLVQQRFDRNYGNA